MPSGKTNSWREAIESIVSRLPKSPRKVAGVVAGVVGVAFASASTTFVAPKQFGVRETLGAVSPKILGPGLYFQVPFAQYTHPYNEKTQRITFEAGSGRFLHLKGNTADHNILLADVALNYKVTKNTDNLSYWLWPMQSWGGPDGYWITTKVLNDSANFVMGQRSLSDTLANPARFEKDLYSDLKSRLNQYNIPVNVESLELYNLKTTIIPTRTISYQASGLMSAKPN